MVAMTCLCSVMSEDSAEKTQMTGDDSTKLEVEIIQKLLHSQILCLGWNDMKGLPPQCGSLVVSYVVAQGSKREQSSKQDKSYITFYDLRSNMESQK